jgi:Cellulase (glycosyl hydrolase family 5)
LTIAQQNPDVDDDQYEFTKEDNWFKDKYGRYVIFRGINFAQRTKLPPYLPLVQLDVKTASCEDVQQEIQNREKDLSLLKDLGFNVVRLLVIWKAIEPSVNQELKLLPDGERYLQLVKTIIDHLYYKLGIYTIIDFHQDIAHEDFGGDGFPDWTIKKDVYYFLYKIYHYFFEPDQLKRSWYVKYFTNKLVRRTLEDFWENRLINNTSRIPIRSHYEKAVLQTVTFLRHSNNGRRHPGILGYELFNEPYQVNFTQKEFETSHLNRLYSSIIGKMRIIDSKSFIFIEPRADWNLYPVVDIEKLLSWKNRIRLKLKIKNISSLIEESKFKPKFELLKIKTYLSESDSLLNSLKESGVFSFHYYDPKIMFLALTEKAFLNMRTKDLEWEELFNEMYHEAVSTGCIPFITEFGANYDWKIKIDEESEEIYKIDQKSQKIDNNDNKFLRAYIDLQYRQIERLLLNSTYWVYDLYNTEKGNDNWNMENFSILGPKRKPRHRKIIARPYPMRSSAKPELLFFDLKSKLCTIMLNGESVDEPTLIFIPSKIQYNSKFQVFATIRNNNRTKYIQKDSIDWNIEDQILSWYPDKDMQQNQIIITPIDKKEPDNSIMPEKSQLFFDENKDKFANFKIDQQYVLKLTK